MRPAVRLLPILAVALLAACASPEDRVAGYLAKARAAMTAGDFAQAKLQAKNAVQIEPKNAAAHFILAQVAWHDGNFAEAFPQLQMAVEADPALLEARLRLGDLYFSVGDAKGAAEQAEAARKLAPDRAEVHLLNSKVAFLQGDSQTAATEIDAALAANPAYVDAINGKAGLLSAAGDNAGALAVLDAGLKNASGADAEALQDARLRFLRTTGQYETYESGLLDLVKAAPERPKYRYLLLDFYTAQGRRADQERVLRELVTLDPGNASVTVRLANIIDQQGDAAGAEKLLKDSIARSPGQADLQIGLGDYYRYSKRPAEAMATYRKAAGQWAATTPEGQRARNRIVAQHVLDGHIDEARAEIAGILKVAPDNTDALLSRATFAFADRQYEAAISDARAVVRRQSSPGALLLLARCYLGVGDVTVAKDTYRRLVAAYPDNTEGARELAMLLTDEGDAAGAEAVLREVQRARPDDPQLTGALIASLLAQQDRAGAEAEARRLLERGGSTMDVQEQAALAGVLQATGSNAEALSRYKAVLEKDPRQPEALRGLVRVMIEMGQADEAIAFLERYPKDDVDASLLRGYVYGTQGDAKAARQVYEQVIAQQPTDGRAYVGLAGLSPPDSVEQLQALERGWKARPGDPLVGIYLAGVYQRQGKTEPAIALYEAMLKEAPANPFVINNLASLLVDSRSDAKSLARGLELAKPLASANDAISLDTVGWAYYRNGDFKNAVSILERAVAASGRGNPLLRYHLGKAYLAAGNKGAAEQELRESLRLSRGDAEFADDARAMLAKVKPGETLVDPDGT